MADLIPRESCSGIRNAPCRDCPPTGPGWPGSRPHEGVLNVWVAPMRATADEAVDWSAARVVTDDPDRGIRMFSWAHDGRHLLYLQDTGGDENWRLHDVNLDTMQRRDLTPFDGVQTQLIAVDKKFPTEILIGLNRDNPQLHDVYRLDLLTGEMTLEVKNPGFVGLGRRRGAGRPGRVRAPARRRPGPHGAGPDAGRLAAAADHLRRRRDRQRRRSRSARTAGRCWASRRSSANTGRLVRIDLASGDDRGAGRGPRGRRGRRACCTPTPASRRSSRSSRTAPSTWCWTRRSRPTWRRSGRCTPATRRSAAATTPTRPGWSRSTTTPGSVTYFVYDRRTRTRAVPVRAPPGAGPLRARARWSRSASPPGTA